MVQGGKVMAGSDTVDSQGTGKSASLREEIRYATIKVYEDEKHER